MFLHSFEGHLCSTQKNLSVTMLAPHEASNYLTLLPWFMKGDIVISRLESLEYMTNVLQYRFVFFKGFLHSSFFRRIFTAMTLSWPLIM